MNIWRDEEDNLKGNRLQRQEDQSSIFEVVIKIERYNQSEIVPYWEGINWRNE